MKRILIVALILFTLGANAQTVDLRRKINVAGTAEMEVTPDIINFSISLKEYMDGRNRVTIDGLENQLVKAVSDAGIPKGDLTINNIAGYTTIQKKKDPNFLASKQYTIKFHDLTKINQILSALDAKAVENTGVISSEYSKMPELKKELKMKAIKAAKEKAGYLLEAIGEKLGSAIEINDIDNGADQVMQANVAFKSYRAVPGTEDSSVDFKKIKLSFQVNVVFEIVK